MAMVNLDNRNLNILKLISRSPTARDNESSLNRGIGLPALGGMVAFG